MRHENAPGSSVDWKALGYLISMISVLFLGAIAWPEPQDPKWHLPALIVGMTTSILGMGLRYKSYLQQKKELRPPQSDSSRS